ncbi:MAG: acetate--CoA ligase family protein [bacterium]
MSHPLETLFRPSSVAVVGASSNPEKLGYVLLKNVVDYGFKGKLYPINPGGGEILGYKAQPSLRAVGEPIDLALISIPGHLVPEVIEDAGECGCRNAVVLSSGFGEAGEAGKAVEEQILSVCQRTGMRVLGPNCMGVYNNTDNLNGTYFWELPRIRGNVSFISQSGAYGGIMFNEIRAREMGVSKFFSIGNQADITHADLLEALAEDEDTRVIGLFIEAVKDGSRFLAALARITAERPVVAFKAGRSEAGVRAAASHTGSLAGSYAIYQSALQEAGAIVADDSEEFFDSLMALSRQRPPKGRRVAILTISGGPCVVAGDTCERLGIEVPELGVGLQQDIRTLTPPFAATSNPVDMTPQMNPANFIPCVDLVMGQDLIDGAIAINVGLDRSEFAKAFIEAGRIYQKPVVTFTIDTPVLSGLFKESGIPIYPTPERAVKAYRSLITFAERSLKTRFEQDNRRIEASNVIAKFIQDHPTGGILPETAAKKALTQYGIPVTDEVVVKYFSETVRAAEDLGYPLVLKVHSNKILHKTETAGVILNISDESALRQAWQTLNNRFPDMELLLQRMEAPGLELILGAKRDQTFGPIVSVGLGGIFVEVFKDTAIGVCPLEEAQVQRMLRSLRAYQILKGYRNQPGADEDALVQTLLQVSDFMLANLQVMELDINPLIARGKELVAVDALVRVVG